MPTPDRQVELLAEARRVDTALGRVDCDRSDVAPIVQRYISGRGTHEERLAQARALAKHLPTSWMLKRSKQMHDRLPVISREFGQVLDHDYPEDELRFLLGWILRLAKMRKNR